MRFFRPPLRHAVSMERRNDNLKRRKAPCNRADLDPRLVELVKFLACAAAEKDYDRLQKDGKTPPDQGDDR